MFGRMSPHTFDFGSNPQSEIRTHKKAHMQRDFLQTARKKLPAWLEFFTFSEGTSTFAHPERC